MTLHLTELQSDTAPVCPICNLAVPLETAKTDESGTAVHEQCYLLALRQKNDVAQSDPAP